MSEHTDPFVCFGGVSRHTVRGARCAWWRTTPRPDYTVGLDNGSVSTESKVCGREPIRIHPDDATQRGINDGDIVLVRSGVATLLTGAVIDDRLMRHVVRVEIERFTGEVPDVTVHGQKIWMTPAERAETTIERAESAFDLDYAVAVPGVSARWMRILARSTVFKARSAE